MRDDTGGHAGVRSRTVAPPGQSRDGVVVASDAAKTILQRTLPPG